MQINGLAALVTGGGSGLGAATAQHLASLGAKVAVADINQAAAETMAARIGGIGIACDVSDSNSGQSAFAAARNAHGPVRILVNCAGVGTAGRIVGRDGPLALEAFERVIRINLIGSFNMLRLAAAEMSAADPLEENERGVIVNTASIAAYEGQIGQPAYAASKGGVVGMTLPAARELARAGVRVVTIAPGLVPHTDGRGPAARGPGQPRRRHPLPPSPGPPERIRPFGGTHRQQPLPQRRGHPPGRGTEDAAEVIAPVCQPPRGISVNATTRIRPTRLPPCIFNYLNKKYFYKEGRGKEIISTSTPFAIQITSPPCLTAPLTLLPLCENKNIKTAMS
jgi:NAD(P)-dependent dehydrogenase (short-subunit alcohol dehydrogenase family)